MSDAAVLRQLDAFQISGERGFRAWARAPRAQLLGKGKFAELGQEAADLLAKTESYPSTMSRKQQSELAAAMTPSSAAIAKAFADGVRSGRNSLRQALAHAEKLTADLDPTFRDEVTTNLYARYYVLLGFDADAAWAAAQEAVARLKRPARPASAAPAQRPPPTGPQAPARPGAPAPAQRPGRARANAVGNRMPALPALPAAPGRGWQRAAPRGHM